MAVAENDQQSQSAYLTVTYDPLGQGTTVHAAVIPRTENYTVALNFAKEALQKYFPAGSSDKSRWLAIPVTTAAGLSWAEVSPKVFPEIVKEKKVELRLVEGYQHVSVLPLGNQGDTSYEFKLITIGESGVGKSMMIQHFTKPEGKRRNVLPATINVLSDISTRFMTTKGARIKVCLWDTAGSEEYRSVAISYYRRANGVFLVYSVTDRLSFLACWDWLKDLRTRVDEEVPIILVGNQIDLSQSRTVKTSEGEEFALTNGLLFAEISAKNGTGIEYAFQTLVDEVFGRLDKQNRLSEYETSRKIDNLELDTQGTNRSYLSGCASSTYDTGLYVAVRAYSGVRYMFGYDRL
ncbi:GTP-binding protein YPT31/YPT8 [Rhizoctonia solani]|uniref:GTP-binding protein YPT31/YPT8 n=1 Tax=Rhizoctonia solani TaxID=456999 RepID=A0A0K6G0N9_9AGAM|nr:GTP-binding protein YPT31/YPT8 [Rhizoctonia solani]